jgi:hypothetical protein
MAYEEKWPRQVNTVDDLLRLLGVNGMTPSEQEEAVEDYMRTMQRVAPESIKQELRDRNLFGFPKQSDREARREASQEDQDR